MEIESTNLEANTSTSTYSTKLLLCEVCGSGNGRYTCPRCELKTCSVRCNKIHKLEIDCNGERDRTKFVPLNKFTNLDLSSDYRLLEEISRSLEVAKKNFGYKWNSHHVMKLRNAAKLRKVDLKFLPSQFSRHKNNTTNFQPTMGQIFWNIEWVFVNAEKMKIHDENIPENQKLSIILQKYFDNKLLEEKLQFYQAVGLPGIKLYLKAEQKKDKKFYELEINATLKESLANKIIIEYPTIHVVLKDHGCGYNVIDSDDEDDIGINKKFGNEVVNSIVSKAENDMNKSSKNLLFISEYSDDELL